MATVKNPESRADLGEVAEAGLHLPEPTDICVERELPRAEDCGDPDQEHQHGFDVVEVLRVVFVALAATAVWFHRWEPFPRVNVVGLAAILIGG